MVTVLLSTLLFSDLQPLDLSQLATELESRSKRPTLFVSGGASQFSVDLSLTDPDAFVEPISRAGSTMLRSDMTVVRPTILPAANWGVLKSLVDGAGPSKLSTVSIPSSAVKAGKLTFTSEKGAAVDLKSIGNLPFEKKIQLAGYFEGTQNSPFLVALNAPKGVDGIVLAQSLATGLGGKFRVSDKVWFVDFDSQAWRRGFSGLYSKALEGVRKGKGIQPLGYDPSNGPVYDYQPQMPSLAQTKESREMALSLLNQTVASLTDPLIEQTFAYPNTTTRLNLRNYSSLQRPVGAFLQSVMQKSANGAAVNRPGAANATLPANLLSRVDPANPGELIIETNFRMSVELNLRGPRGGDSQEPMKVQIL